VVVVSVLFILNILDVSICTFYRGADKSLTQPWKEKSYSDQDLQHYTKTNGVQTTRIYSCCFLLFPVGCCSLFPSRVGLRAYQHPCASSFTVRMHCCIKIAILVFV